MRNNAAVRARTRKTRKIDATLGGQTPRERRHHRAAGKRRRTIIAFRCADLAEWIHWRSGTRHRRGMHRCSGSSRCRTWLWRRGLRRSGCCGRRACRSTCPHNHRHHGADLGHLADLKTNIGQRSARRRRHLHRGLVGLDLEQIVARLHRVAGSLEPFCDLALGNGFAELRHQNVHANLQKFPARLTTSPRHIVSLEIPSCLPGRLRARGRTA